MSSPIQREGQARAGPCDVPGRFAGSYVRILEALCGTTDLGAAGEKLLSEVSELTGCEAVGLRVHDRRDDYPYFVCSGFDDAFIEKESRLCHVRADGRVEREANGRAVLECMCGLVLRGRTDPAAPFFTENGSFWTNSTTDLLAGTTDDARGTVTRNTCSIWGYESVALVPIRYGDEIIGLIQVNSRRRGRLDPATIAFLERVGGHAGSAVRAAWRREELERVRKELEGRRRRTEVLVAMGEMTSALAHEVKNPLAGMMLSATRLRKALAGDEKLSAVAEHLCSSVGALSDTVTRLTGSLRSPKLERTELNAADVLESAVSLIAPTASAQGVRIIREFSPGLPKVAADPGLLRIAFLNLLLNALEAMPSSGTLRARTRKVEEDGVEVAIADTGPGINPDEAGELFEPFVSTKPEGTGLGLGIVRRIVELHSGTVALRPRAGGGTEAVLRLPASGAGAASS